MNIVPKTGGNTIKGTVYVAGVSSGMVGSNYTDGPEGRGPAHARRAAEAVGLHRRRRRAASRRIACGTSCNVARRRQLSSVPGMYANMNAGDPGEVHLRRRSDAAGRDGAAAGRSPTCA